VSKDLNDKLRDGTLPKDPKDGTVPANEAARRKAEAAPMNVRSVRHLLDGAAERACNPKRLEDACTTGHYQIDQHTGGMRPGFVWVFGADTSFGKSTLATAISDANIQRNKRPLIVSVEDPEELYGDRLLARRSRVNFTRLTRGQCNPKEREAIWHVQARAEDQPVYCFAGTKPIEQIAKELNVIIRSEGIDIVFYDYLQEFQSNKRHQDERTKFKHISSVMRDVIRSNNKTGMILSQLTITTETKVPNKHNIRESRDVSNAAEVVAIGFCPDANVARQGGSDSDEPLFEKGHKYLLLDKNKAGPAKRFVRLGWNENSACFDDVEDPEQRRLEEEGRRLNEGIDDGFEWDNLEPRQHWQDN